MARARPGSVAHPHTGTGLNFPEKVEKELSASCLRRHAQSRCRAGQRKHMDSGQQKTGLALYQSPGRALDQQRAAGGQPQAADPHLPGDRSPSFQAEIKVIVVSLGEGEGLALLPPPPLDPVRDQAPK